MEAPSLQAPMIRYSSWLRERYGAPTYRIPVDAGFTCPVRVAGSPCAYCDEGGSRASFVGEAIDVESQIDRAVARLRRRNANAHYQLYLQAYTNTFASVGRLRRVYDRALAAARARARVVGFIVGTRPDCIDEERCRLLSRYRRDGLDVCVELGLESVNDATLARVGRGHDAATFVRAANLLHEHHVDTAAHLILGLPGDGIDEAIAGARFLSALPVMGVKYHNLVVVEGSTLYRERESGVADVRPPDLDRYVDLLRASLEHLRGDIVVMRLTCDPPPGLRHVPDPAPSQAVVRARLAAEFANHGTWQGIYWRQHADQG